MEMCVLRWCHWDFPSSEDLGSVRSSLLTCPETKLLNGWKIETTHPCLLLVFTNYACFSYWCMYVKVYLFCLYLSHCVFWAFWAQKFYLITLRLSCAFSRILKWLDSPAHQLCIISSHKLNTTKAVKMSYFIPCLHCGYLWSSVCIFMCNLCTQMIRTVPMMPPCFYGRTLTDLQKCFHNLFWWMFNQAWTIQHKQDPRVKGQNVCLKPVRSRRRWLHSLQWIYRCSTETNSFMASSFLLKWSRVTIRALQQKTCLSSTLHNDIMRSGQTRRAEFSVLTSLTHCNASIQV